MKEILRDGKTGGYYDDGSGGGGSGSSGGAKKCPKNADTAAACRGKDVGHYVAGTCTCTLLNTKNCGCIPGKSDGVGGDSKRCEGHGDCGDGSYCGSDKKCKGKVSRQGSCTSAAFNDNNRPVDNNYDIVCSNSLVCNEGRCLPADATGASCSSDSQCNAGTEFCAAGGFCRMKNTPGFPCSNNKQCQSDICAKDGKCRNRFDDGEVPEGIKGMLGTASCKSNTVARDLACGCFRNGTPDHSLCGKKGYCHGSYNSSKCESKLEKNVPCTFQEQCKSGLCSTHGYGAATCQ